MYTQLFTRQTNRKNEIPKLLENIEKEVSKDLKRVKDLADTNPRAALTELLNINLAFHDVFMQVRWADGYKQDENIRFEFSDIQKAIDSTRNDVRMIATLYMSEKRDA